MAEAGDLELQSCEFLLAAPALHPVLEAERVANTHEVG